MFNGNDGYSLSDIAAVTGPRYGYIYGGNGSNGGFGDGFGAGGWWIILLFLLAFGGWGRNNGGGFFGGNSSLASDVGYSFDIHDLDEGIRGLTTSTADGFYNTNTNLLTGFANTSSQICNTGFDVVQAVNQNTLAALQNTNALTSQIAQHSADEQLCCCQTQNLINSNFATLNYNLAREECDTRRAIEDAERDILQNANTNTRQILDFLVQDRITALTNENQVLKGQISQSEQNAYLINALRPSPEPAYLVGNPYGIGYGYGYWGGWNNGWGNNNGFGF